MVQENPKTLLQVLKIAKSNLKHNLLPLLLLSGMVTILTPILFGTTALDKIAAAVPLEMMVSTIGIILLVPVFWPEQNNEIAGVILSKYVSPVYVYLIRIACSVLGIVFLVLMFSAYLSTRGCEITATLIFGTIADAMFLGSLGLVTSAVGSSLSASFMVSLLYYIINITAKDKLGSFNLFAMMSGNNKPNLWLFCASIGLIVVAVVVKSRHDMQ